MRIKLLPLLFLVGCGPYRHLRNDYITLSESPCVDGTILNIDQAGCEAFYWGANSDGRLLKIRCAYSKKENWWTQNSFYAILHDRQDLIHANWALYCEDRYVKMYAEESRRKLEDDN